MQLALRPYITTGVAIVGASVVAVAPIAMPPSPPDIQVANPVAAVERGVQLTANEIEDAVNALVYGFVARPTVASAELLGKLLAPLIGEQQAFLLPIAALGLAGPLISGGGAAGEALQTVIDSHGLQALLTNLVGAPGTLIDGAVNGGYGPNLAPLVADQVAALLSAQFGSSIPPALIRTVLAGGLLGSGELLGTYPFPPPLDFVLPGTIPTLQGLIEQLGGLLGGSDMGSKSLLLAAPDRDIEEGVNALLFAATKATLSLVQLAAPIAAPILGVNEAQAAQFLAIGTLGFIGPGISGTGAFGTALQNLVDSDGVTDFLSNSLDLVGLPINGAVNGGFGPNLKSIVPGLPPAIPLGTGGTAPFIPVNAVYAPGLIANPGYLYDPALGGIGLKFLGAPPAMVPTSVNLITPGTTATLQGLVGRVFDALPSSSAVSTYKAPAGGTTLKLTEDQGDDVGAKVTPKKNRPLQNILKFNPLDQGGKKDDGAASTNKHRPGLGKTPVANLVKRILGGDDHEKKVANTVSEKPDAD
jgi:hypothetical protein